MRWIAPGTFVMGSPENEEGRRNSEGPQHQVTLTQGFWMADTPCIQALWSLVMDDQNPSRFTSPDRPVEQVSWEDVQTFLQRLNEQQAALALMLPTEAQWEYACRAGTVAATYAGDLEIRGARNAPILDAIAWYGGNSGADFDLEDRLGLQRLDRKAVPAYPSGHPPGEAEATEPLGALRHAGQRLGVVRRWVRRGTAAQRSRTRRVLRWATGG